MSPDIQAEIRAFVSDPLRGRLRPRASLLSQSEDEEGEIFEDDISPKETPKIKGTSSLDTDRGYIELEKRSDLDTHGPKTEGTEAEHRDQAPGPSDSQLEAMSQKKRDEARGRVVDVVLSDMCEPWEQSTGFNSRSVSNAYNRMMNTSGMPFRDHAGSMVGIFYPGHLNMRTGVVN